MSNTLQRNVANLRISRGLSEKALAERLSMSPGELEEKLASDRAPRSLITRLSTELVVPDVLLFVEDLKVADPLPDFRLSAPRASGYKSDTVKAIQFARSIKTASDQIRGADRDKSISQLAASREVVDAARQLRKALHLSVRDQIQCKDASAFFRIVRQKTESRSLFILQSSFSDGGGFCLSGSGSIDLIMINTLDQTHGRRLFTLGHEIYHCIINKSGLSDTEITKNEIEKKCNAFAAEFLAPADLVRQAAEAFIKTKDLDLNQLRKAAAFLKISQHATLLRLRELDYYSRQAVQRWHQLFGGAERRHPDLPKKQKGGPNTDQWKMKLSRYGFGFARVFGDALNKGEIDEIDVFRFSRLKPKYQADFFGKAVRAVAADAEEG